MNGPGRPGARDAGYDDFLDALEAGEGYYLECSNRHGSLPPRRACLRCGARDLAERALPAQGVVETYTVVAVPTPAFSDDAPYATAIASFGPLGLTGLCRGVDLDAVETGMAVRAGVEETETAGRRVIVFRPA